MSATVGNRCWGCGEYAPAGVCMRPHPGFSLLRAKQARNVEGEMPAPNAVPAAQTFRGVRKTDAASERKRARVAAWRARNPHYQREYSRDWRRLRRLRELEAVAL